jgi:hypothetical protein
MWNHFLPAFWKIVDFLALDNFPFGQLGLMSHLRAGEERWQRREVGLRRQD